MAKWIETNSGKLVNLERVCKIYTYKNSIIKDLYMIVYCFSANGAAVYCEESAYESEEERDRRFDEIKAMLLGEES